MAQYILMERSIGNTVMHSKVKGIGDELRRGEAEPTERSLTEFLAAKGVNSSTQQAKIERKIRVLFNPNRARKEILQLQKESFDRNNDAHEKMLTQLWNTMLPEEQLTGRTSDQWRKCA